MTQTPEHVVEMPEPHITPDFLDQAKQSTTKQTQLDLIGQMYDFCMNYECSIKQVYFPIRNKTHALYLTFNYDERFESSPLSVEIETSLTTNLTCYSPSDVHKCQKYFERYL